MHVLLTGATGFIGRHMLRRLLRRHDRIRVLALPETVGDVEARDRVQVIAGDLADRHLVARAVRDVEVVIHLAAKVTGGIPAEFRAVNVDGTQHLLDAAAGAGVRRFIYMSSTAVYGLAPFPVMWPLDEESPLAAHGTRTVRLYGWSKIEAERAVRRVHDARGLEYVIVRPTFVYGSGATGAGRLLFSLVPFPSPLWLEIAPDGVVQWMHVSDLTRMIVRTMHDRHAANEAFNAAGPAPITLAHLSGALRSALGCFWVIPPALMRRSVRPIVAPFTTAKAKRLLQFRPVVHVEEGLQEMFAGAGLNGLQRRKPQHSSR